MPEDSQRVAERRRARRVSFLCDVACGGPLPDLLRPRIRNISESGAFIEAATTVPGGTRLALRFELAGRELSVAAEVVRCVPQGVGVRFLELSSEDRAAIAETIAATGGP